MNQSSPDWYDALQGNPLRTRTFTNELETKIRVRVISSVQPSANRRKYWIVAGVLCIIGCIFFASENKLFNQKTAVTIPAHQEKLVTQPTESQLIELINQSKSNQRREILYKESIDDTSMLLFTKKMLTDQHKMIWEVGYTSWTSGGMSWVKEKEGEIQIDLVSESELAEAQDNGETLRFKSQNIPITSDSSSQLLFGSLADPRVSEVRITDESNGGQHDAKLIEHVHGGYSLWFAFLSEKQEKFTVEAIDKDGLVLARLVP